MPRPFGRTETFRRAAGATTPAANVKGAKAFGSFIRLAAKDATLADGWVVLAYEVAMKRSGVTLTRKDFDECVANFNRYPACPITVEHADTEGGPPEWAEPHGHIEEMRVGEMTRTVDGVAKTVATLEGRPSYLEPTAAAIAAGQWRFGSITIFKKAVDEETDTKLGSLLWSWSLTAHPRLMAIPRITASLGPDGAPVTAGWWYGTIETREDLIRCLREILDLAVTTTETEVLAELTKLERLVSAGEADGVDLDCIVNRLRDALRLPALTTSAEVLADVRKGLANLPSEDDADEASGDSAGTDLSLSQRPPITTPAPRSPMALKFVALLATFGLSVATEEEAQPKVEAFARLGADGLKALGLPVTATAAEFSARLSELSTAAAKVGGLETELQGFRAKAAEAEKGERDKYFAELFCVQPELKSAEDSLRLHAERDFAGFSKKYPRPSAEQLLASAQHGARTEQLTGPTSPNAGAVALGNTSPDAPANAIVSMVHTHIAMQAALGRELTFAQALAELA